jgi:two-component system sensor histidine kinase KdpD
VAVATLLLVAGDADLTFAVIVLLLAVAGASVLGYVPGLVAAVASTIVLTYSFTPPLHSFAIDQPDDILALVAFVTVSLLVGATIARLNELRARAEVHARESLLRVTLTQELRRGVAVEIVLRRLAAELTDLFDLVACSVTIDDAAPAAGDVVVDVPPVRVRGVADRELTTGDISVIAGLASVVATAVELERLDAEAREQRIRSELDQSRAALLTAITHDLRTPLATIKAASGALLVADGRLDDAERRELLEDTLAEATRLARLVDKVLEMGRIRSGAVRPDRVATAPLELVQTVITRRGSAIDERGIVLAVDADLPAVDVDVLLMEHVLSNLIENALLHGASSQPVEIRASARDGRVRLAVSDHGAGVPTAERTRVFDEFVRLHAPTDGNGTGLGLTIVRALVDAHDGHVWCEETAGGGATFVVDLPAADERSDP